MQEPLLQAGKPALGNTHRLKMNQGATTPGGSIQSRANRLDMNHLTFPMAGRDTP